MRLSAPLLLLLASIGEETATAFTPSSLINTRSRSHDVAQKNTPPHLSMALSDLPEDIAAPKPKKVLTAADVMAKSSGGGGGGPSADPSAPGEQEAPKLFTPAIYDDFQSALLTLEKRIKEGPGSLSSEEVMQFEEETERIVKEMRGYMSDPKGAGEAIRKGYEKSAPVMDVVAKKEDAVVVVEEPKSTPPPPPPVAVAKPPPVVAPPAPKSPVADADDDDDDDVPPENYPPNEDEPTDAAQSYGLAKGTTNTYLIDGMEEMSPEEYRAKLQETISARQRKRRSTSLEGNRGIIGNASSQGYLDTLSGITGKNNGSPGNKKGEKQQRPISTASSFDRVVVVREKEKSAFDRRWKGENKPRDKSSRLGVMRSAFGLVEDDDDDDDDDDDVSEEEGLEDVQEGQEGQPMGGIAGEEAIASASGNDEGVSIPARAEVNSLQNSTANDELDNAKQAKADSAERLEEQNQLVTQQLEARLKLEEKSPDTPSETGDSPDIEEEPGSIETIATLDSKSESEDPSQHQQKDESESSEDMEKPASSPILTLKQSKIEQEQSRKSEWQQHGDENESSSSKQRPNPPGFFGVHTASSSTSASRKVSSKSTQSFAHGDDEKRTAGVSPKEEGTMPKKFDVHSTGSIRTFGGSTQPVEQRMMDHRDPGDVRSPEKSQTSLQKEEGTMPKKFDVHGAGSIRTFGGSAQRVEQRRMDHRDPGDVRSPEKSQTPLQKIVTDHRGPGDVRTVEPKKYEAPKSLVGVEIRSFGGSAQPVERRRVDHRDPGDVRSPEKSQTPLQKITTDHRGPGDVRTVEPKKYEVPKSLVGEAIRQRPVASTAEGAPKSLVGTTDQQRPVASSYHPEYATTSDHRAVGDTRVDPEFLSPSQSSAKSLIETDIRIRPASSSKLPAYVRASDHRGVGDRRKSSPRSNAPVKSLVEMEGRVRPTPSSSNPPENDRVMNHRSVGDMKDPRKSKSLSNTVSLAEGEERVRPIPSSKPYNSGISDHRGPGDTNALTRREQSKPSVLAAKESLIEREDSIRPVSSSKNHPHGYGKSADHRGPGDGHALTRREKSLSTEHSSQSLIKSEYSSRPVSSSSNSAHGFGKVVDHRDPGDSRKEQPSSTPPPKVQSLISNEGQSRPVVSSSANSVQGYGKTSVDHRGPGDSNALTRREKSSSTSLSSLIDSEQRVRPAPTSDQFKSFQVGDHRDVGDTRSITSKVQAPAADVALTAADTPSLSEDEQRQRPVPRAGGPSQVSDHRWPGDARTITWKVKSSFTGAAVVASLSEDEQRMRPVPLANHHKAVAVDGSDEPLAQEDGAQWWNEETQRHSFASSTPKAKVLGRSMDDTIKEKEIKAAEDSSMTSPEESSQSSSFALKSLLKDKKERWLTSVRTKMSPTMNKSPIAEIPPSSLQSLLTQDEESSEQTSTNSGRKASQLSSLLKDDQAKRSTSPTPKKRGFWNESPQRPRGYTKHNQPLKPINIDKNEAPPDYGNVVET